MEIVMLVLGAGTLFVAFVLPIALGIIWAFVRIGQAKSHFDFHMAELHVRHSHLEFERKRYEDMLRARQQAFEQMGVPRQGFPYPPPKRGPRDDN